MKHLLIGTVCCLALSTAVVAQVGVDSIPAPSHDVTLLVVPADTLEGVYQTDDLETAKTVASANGSDILMVFAGSDWCRPCKMFKRSVLDTPEFQEGAKQDITILYLDFPAKRSNQLPAEQKAANEALAARFNPQGSFPKLVLMAPDSEEALANLEYAGQDAETFLQELHAARDAAR